MKKIILTSTALLAFAAASYAQINQTGVQQYAEQIRNGNNQTGTINQLQGTNTNYGNYAITIQGQQSNTGPANADINQNNGSQGNRAGITQNGGTQVFATINQNGGPNGLSGGGVSASATIGAPAQDGNFAGIAQQGNNLQATINQNNNSRRNRGELYQNGSTLVSTLNQSNGAINNTGLILQGYSGQNVIGTGITNATATINQGRVNEGGTSNGQVVPESVSSSARIIQNANFITAQINQGSQGGTNNNNGFSNSNGRADGSQATIEQRAGSTNSTALIEQGILNSESFGSRATLIQTATNNVGIIGQGGSSQGLGINFSNGSNLTGSDQGSVATLTQNGSDTGNGIFDTNTGYIAQGVAGAESVENVATLTQAVGTQQIFGSIRQGSGTGIFVANSEARITQAGKGTAAAAFSSYAEVVQGLNFFGSTVISRLNLGIIDQQAGVTDGKAQVFQGVSLGSADIIASRNVGTITQISGTNIQALIQQGTDQFFNGSVGTDIFGSSITPGNISTNNTGTIRQDGGTGHTANLAQNGRFNTGLINQSGAGTTTNAATIIQVEGANRGYAEILQNAGANNTARITQLSGSDTDNNGVGNYAKIQQLVGSNNLAIVQQGRPTSTGPNSSNDNYFDLIQNGSSNNVQFLQQGNNNYAMIRQNGNNNVVQGVGGGVATQVGYNNRLVLTQNGTASSSLVFSNTQVGNNLTALQTQFGN